MGLFYVVQLPVTSERGLVITRLVRKSGAGPSRWPAYRSGVAETADHVGDEVGGEHLTFRD